MATAFPTAVVIGPDSGEAARTIKHDPSAAIRICRPVLNRMKVPPEQKSTTRASDRRSPRYTPFGRHKQLRIQVVWRTGTLNGGLQISYFLFRRLLFPVIDFSALPGLSMLSLEEVGP
jgi:hypothetical protein